MNPPLLVKIQLDTYRLVCPDTDVPGCNVCSFYRPQRPGREHCEHPHRNPAAFTKWCPGRLLNRGRRAAFVRLNPLETEELDI